MPKSLRFEPFSSKNEGSCYTDFDLVCFSHLRWDFVYQRPQHLLSRFARQQRVFFVEEPIFVEGPARVDIKKPQPGLYIVVPYLPKHLAHSSTIVDELFRKEVETLQRQLLNTLFMEYSIATYLLWYYTPMALTFSRHLQPVAIVYDCMDELTAFKNAPPALKQYEAELFKRADLVFTGGQSLYESKRHLHPAVYAFPSSVDTNHFKTARVPNQQDPTDQVQIPHPRLGFYGVIDERLDMHLLSAVADEQPDWHIILLGPVVKIDLDSLSRRANIHYLGRKTYEELPAYLAGWDVTLLPFALNASTRFISPTKTLEYLAGGKPVISTPIHDVVNPYGQQGLVYIADTPDGFVEAIGRALRENSRAHLSNVDALLSQTSWNSTWESMRNLIEETLTAR